jgi:hypothetical protein
MHPIRYTCGLFWVNRQSDYKERKTMRKRAIMLVNLGVILLFFSVWVPSLSWAGGWYLMEAPPKESKSEHKPDLSYPLRQWDQHKSFDSASECETARIRGIASDAVLVAIASVTPDEPFNEDKYRTLTSAVEQFLLVGDSSKIPPNLIRPIARAVLDLKPGYLCIATDDPRLK